MGRRGILNFFFVGGAAFLVAAAVAVTTGGLGGTIAGSTFAMIGIIWMVVSLLVTGLYGRMAAGQRQELDLFRSGTRATAVIDSVETTGLILNNINVRIILTLTVTPPYGPAFKHTRKLFVPTYAVPRPGDTLNVAFDPNDTSKVALEFNPASNTAGGIQLVTSSPESTPAAAAGSAITELEALERLQALRTQGALNDADFETQKRRIIDRN